MVLDIWTLYKVNTEASGSCSRVRNLNMKLFPPLNSWSFLGVFLIVSTIFCWELRARKVKVSFSRNFESRNRSQRNPYKLKVIQLKPQRIEIEIRNVIWSKLIRNSIKIMIMIITIQMDQDSYTLVDFKERILLCWQPLLSEQRNTKRWH